MIAIYCIFKVVTPWVLREILMHTELQKLQLALGSGKPPKNTHDNVFSSVVLLTSCYKSLSLAPSLPPPAREVYVSHTETVSRTKSITCISSEPGLL